MEKSAEAAASDAHQSSPFGLKVRTLARLGLVHNCGQGARRWDSLVLRGKREPA
ncbi:MAG: hypothetical protein WBL65_14945 [Bryobacteraceae bacterium]